MDKVYKSIYINIYSIYIYPKYIKYIKYIKVYKVYKKMWTILSFIVYFKISLR